MPPTMLASDTTVPECLPRCWRLIQLCQSADRTNHRAQASHLMTTCRRCCSKVTDTRSGVRRLASTETSTMPGVWKNWCLYLVSGAGVAGAACALVPFRCGLAAGLVGACGSTSAAAGGASACSQLGQAFTDALVPSRCGLAAGLVDAGGLAAAPASVHSRPGQPGSLATLEMYMSYAVEPVQSFAVCIKAA